LGLLCVAAPVFAADRYQTNLGPMPLDDQGRLVIQGRGDATATLDGKKLTVSGTFHGLVSPATVAHLYLSPAIGVPGVSQLSLTVAPATSGTVTGDVTLTAVQAAALRTGKLYIQIDSQKAPTGNLWGWLLPAHEVAGPNVPQQGHWFVPQLDTPSH
jgi:hypothetical protein